MGYEQQMKGFGFQNQTLPNTDENLECGEELFPQTIEPSTLIAESAGTPIPPTCLCTGCLDDQPLKWVGMAS